MVYSRSQFRSLFLPSRRRNSIYPHVCLLSFFILNIAHIALSQPFLGRHRRIYHRSPLWLIHSETTFQSPTPPTSIGSTKIPSCFFGCFFHWCVHCVRFLGLDSRDEEWWYMCDIWLCKAVALHNTFIFVIRYIFSFFSLSLSRTTYIVFLF